MLSKKIKLLLLSVLILNTGIVNSQEANVTVVAKDVKVVPIKLQRDPRSNAISLQTAIKAEMARGWVYFSHMTIEGQFSEAQMLIFKKY